MRILIAEDDTALAGFVRKGLEAEHHTVDVSNDGEQARALATELDYDLIILDLNLPRFDGVNILRRVRAEKPNLPILVLTARGRVDDRVTCFDTGADDDMVKPFSFSELSARIRALLRRSRLPSESVLFGLRHDSIANQKIGGRVDTLAKNQDLARTHVDQFLGEPNAFELTPAAV